MCTNESSPPIIANDLVIYMLMMPGLRADWHQGEWQVLQII